MKNTLRCLLAIVAVWILQPVSAQVDQRIDKVIRGVNFVGVSVSDISQSLSLYVDSVKLETVQTGIIASNPAFDALAARDNVTAETALLKSSNAQLRFMQFDSSSAARPNSAEIEVYGPGIAHICFQVADTTQTYQQFLRGGAIPIGASEMVQLNPRNPVVYAYARDTDGTIIEVEHIDFDKVSTERNNDYRIRHISLASPDIDRMVAFYSVLMEEPAPRRLGQGGTLAGENFDKVSGQAGTQMEMAWFQVRNLELEVVQYHSHPTQLASSPRPVDAHGYNMVVFDVTDIQAAREILLAAGGVIATESTMMDGGEIFFGRDPDGNLLGFQAVDMNSKLSSQNFDDNGV